MDIVQYLHGLVSPSLGDEVQSDLLKQYYALSVCHVAQTGVDTSVQIDLVGLWGSQAQALVKRLSRSFHVSANEVSTQLNQATPIMMSELSSVQQGQSWGQVLGAGVSALYLPAWAGEFISAQFVHMPQPTKHRECDEPNANTDALTEASDMPSADAQGVNVQDMDTQGTNESMAQFDERALVADDAQSSHTQITPKPSKHTKKVSPVAWGLGILALMAVAGLSTGAWYLYQSFKKDDTTTAATNTTDPTLNPPRLLLTTGENGTLYGCLVEVGNNALQAQLVQILQKNFGQMDCVIDIDNSFGSSLVGLERLESIIAMMKSEAFTSIEIVGNQIMVNHPKTDVLNRMVGDIGLLAPQFHVQAVPPLDKVGQINASIAKATDAINALTNSSTPYQLVRAVNLQHIDFYGTTELPAQHHAVLGLLAQKLIQNPAIKLIIVSHTDASNPDTMANVALSQAQAQAVKDFLVQAGVPESQLIAKGVGHAFAISDNITETGQFKNRRVEFLVFDDTMMTMLSDKINKTTTPTAPYERPQMVESAPYVPSGDITAEPMPVNGMPPVMAPEPVRNEASMVQSTPMSQSVPVSEAGYVEMMPEMPTGESAAPIVPNVSDTIPQEVKELSETSIGSDGVLRGPSYEIRK